MMTLHEQLGARRTYAEILTLDDPITSLSIFDERKVRIIEPHFFGGLTCEEMDEALEAFKPLSVVSCALRKPGFITKLNKKGGRDER